MSGTRDKAGGLPDAVARLMSARAGAAPFLGDHHIEAARRLTGLMVRARLAQRVTMSYDPTRLGARGSFSSAQADLTESAAGARQRLQDLARRLPADCWSILFDVCGLEKGLQEIETARDWPRRSAKLVLRVALEQLAWLYGLDEQGVGAGRVRERAWLPERPPLFATESPKARDRLQD